MAVQKDFKDLLELLKVSGVEYMIFKAYGLPAFPELQFFGKTKKNMPLIKREFLNPVFLRKRVSKKGRNLFQLLCRKVWVFGLMFLFIDNYRFCAAANESALTFYIGQITTGEVANPFSQNVRFVDGYIFVAAWAWTMRAYLKGAFSMELEGQIGKYFRGQKNWEINLALAGRWHRFPWRERITTSIAWGIGPSYATEVPSIEEAINETSKQMLVYWFAEATFGPPKAKWNWVLRLHHRSPGFGLLGTKGGANILCSGLKFYF